MDICKYNTSVRCNAKVIDCDYCEIYKVYQQGRTDKYNEIASEYILLTEEQVNQMKADVFNSLNRNCKYSHFTFDTDNHCSGYNYCTLKGFDCVCCFENCVILKEQK